MQHSYKTSDLIGQNEADELGLNVFYWNTRKSSLTAAEKLAEEVKWEQRQVYNKEAQKEAKRLTLVSKVALQEGFNRMQIK